jgi:hypothetical protein
VGDPEVYDEALSFYANTNPADGHAEVIEIILRIGIKNVDTLRA